MTITIELINKKAYKILQDLQDVKLIKLVDDHDKKRTVEKFRKKLKDAFKDIDLHQKGKLQLKSLDELLDEL